MLNFAYIARNACLFNQYLLPLHKITSIMTRQTKGTMLNRRLSEILTIVGEQIKLARLRRNLSTEQVALRVMCSRNTITQVEKGSASVSIGIYSKVLYVLGLEDSLLNIAQDDRLGRDRQDIELRKRATKK